MTKQGYPESLNCWLRDYPRFIKVTFGSEMNNLDGPWNNGSVILLERIGIDLPDTNPVVDEIPPDIKVTYSNTGTDVGWIFKIGMYGWGTFFATTGGVNYYVDLEKWLEFESTYFSKIKFRYRTVVQTQIPKTESIPSVNIPEEIIYNPPVGQPQPDPVEPTPTPVSNYWGSVALTLINYYWSFWNINTLYSHSMTVTQTSNLSPVGRQIGPVTDCAGQTAEFWVFGGVIKILLYSIAYECEGFLSGEPVDCTYSSYVSSAYNITSLIINGVNRLPDLIRRA